MKSLIAFWKRDIVNKLIVITSLTLAGGIFAFGWLIFTMPQGKSLSEAFADFIPERATQTFDVNSYLTPDASTPAVPIATEGLISLPTFTLPPPTPIVEPPTPTLELLPTPAMEILPASTTELTLQTLQPSTQVVSNGSFACIPNNPRKTGKVIEVLDGNTVRVLIDKLVYVIRYTGVAALENKNFSKTAKDVNTKLVYGQEITLVSDASDKDDRGRLLRYVLAGDKFINLVMIQQGLGTALDVPPNSACAQIFKQAQQSSSASMLGIWSLPATPSP